MHKKTAPLFVHYGEPEKIKKSFAFNVDIFTKENDCIFRSQFPGFVLY